MKRIPLLLCFGILAASVGFACNSPASSNAGVQNQAAQSQALPAHNAGLQTIAMLQQQAKPDQGTASPAQSSPPVTSQTPAAPNPPTTGTPPAAQANSPTSNTNSQAGETTGGGVNNQGVNNPGTNTSANSAGSASTQQQSNASDQNKPLYERQATDIPWAQHPAGNSGTPPPPH